jgi:hypothetical protein
VRISLTREHDGKVDDLFTLLTDPDSIAARRPDLAEPPAVRNDRGATEVEIRRTVGVPDAAEADRMISPVLDLRETMRWHRPGPDDVRRAAITTAIAGAPVRVEGTYELAPTPDGCRSTIDLEVTCTVAMLGGRLMAVVRDMAEHRLNTELDWIDAALNLRRP